MPGLVVNSLSVLLRTKGSQLQRYRNTFNSNLQIRQNLLGQGSLQAFEKFLCELPRFLAIKENNKITRVLLCKHSIKESGTRGTVMLSSAHESSFESHGCKYFKPWPSLGGEIRVPYLALWNPSLLLPKQG